MQRTWVRSLVEELSSHMLQSGWTQAPNYWAQVPQQRVGAPQKIPCAATKRWHRQINTFVTNLKKKKTKTEAQKVFV